MPLPTPQENAATDPATATAAGTDWKNLPTTNATEARAVALVAQKYGQAKGDEFRNWYDQARLQDPNITPTTAILVFIVGAGVAGGVAVAANFLTGAPANVSSGGVDLGTASGSVGVGQAAASAAAHAVAVNPLTGIAGALRAFYDEVTNGNVWKSVGWGFLGAVMLLSGAWLFASHFGVVPPPSTAAKAALL